ncbi:MAG: ABC transporter substrate-binding protein, partial [Defluviitaleaceae bacterium]|nr:ABC transporter substrate-binding protein [Defluviitaleaceae bacterium]
YLATPAFFPQRRDIVSKNPDGWTKNAEELVTNGPFVIEQISETKLSLKASGSYWNKAAVSLAGLEFTFKKTAGEAAAAYKKGDMLMTDIKLSPSDAGVEPFVSALAIKPVYATTVIAVNVHNELLSFPEIRQALAYAIDRQYITEQVTQNNEVPASGIVPPGVPDMVAGDTFRKMAGEYFDAFDASFDTNLLAARRLLAAGFSRAEEARLETVDDEGEEAADEMEELPLTLNIVLGAKTKHAEVAENIAQMWKEYLGVDVRVVTQEPAVFKQSLQDSVFDAAVLEWQAAYIDALAVLELYADDHPANAWEYFNKDYYMLIQTAISTESAVTRFNAMREAEAVLIADEMAVIPLYYSNNEYLVSPKLKGLVFNPLGYVYYGRASVEGP